MKLKEAQMLGILALIAIGIILWCMWSGGDEVDVEDEGGAETNTAHLSDVSSEPDVLELYKSVLGADSTLDAQPASADEEVSLEVGTTRVIFVAEPSEDAVIRTVIEERAPEDIRPVTTEKSAAQEEPRRAPKPLRKIIHVVQKGETLSHISQQYYGTSRKWRSILDANKAVLNDPKRLRPDMKLTIPALDGVAVATATTRSGGTAGDGSPRLALSAAAAAGADPSRTYTVKKGDTLFRISMRCYDDGTRWRDILAANRHQLSDPRRDLRPDMKLIIP